VEHFPRCARPIDVASDDAKARRPVHPTRLDILDAVRRREHEPGSDHSAAAEIRRVLFFEEVDHERHPRKRFFFGGRPADDQWRRAAEAKGAGGMSTCRRAPQGSEQSEKREGPHATVGKCRLEVAAHGVSGKVPYRLSNRLSLNPRRPRWTGTSAVPHRAGAEMPWLVRRRRRSG
jgi:hypothetical protein